MATPSNIPTRLDLLVLPGKRSIGDRTSEKKRLRRRVILRTILLEGPISRAEISRRLEFNPQTVKLVVPDLLREGLILEEQEEPHGQMGRPASPCRINPDAAMFLGIAEVGGKLSILALDTAGNELGNIQENVPSFANPAARASWVADQCTRFYHRLGKPQPLAGAALALDEPVPTERETHPGVPIPVPGTLPFLYRRELEARLGVPVLVDNQSRMLAMGARWFGSAKEFEDVVYLDLGDSFHITSFVNGRILAGSTGFAGNLGNAPAAVAEGGADGPLPRSFDEFLSVGGFRALAKEIGYEGDLQKFATKADKDYKARDLAEAYARHLAMPVAILLNLFNPQAVIIGGPLSRYAEAFLPPLQDTLFRSVSADLLARTDIVIDRRSTEPLATARGAAAMVFDLVYSAAYAEIVDVI